MNKVFKLISKFFYKSASRPLFSELRNDRLPPTTLGQYIAIRLIEDECAFSYYKDLSPQEYWELESRISKYIEEKIKEYNIKYDL